MEYSSPGSHLTLDLVSIEESLTSLTSYNLLPTAKFAFLAACHMAGLNDESLTNKALHLTANSASRDSVGVGRHE